MEALRAFSLPPGFGFHPTDIELISHYLKRKILGLKIDFNVISEIDIYKHEPWDLPAKCQVPTRDSKWHFFASRDRKYPNGSRSNRTTEAGYWKSTGKDRNIKYQNRVIGTKKTLVFHEGRPPCGKRTDWIMHEYYISESECKATPDMKDAFVLCRVTKRNGWGPDSENVSLQYENVQSENKHDCTKEPQDLALSVMTEKPSSPSESVEDIEAWVSELFEPNPTLGELKSEPEEGLSPLVLNPEPIDSYYTPEASEDPRLLFRVDEFCGVVQADDQSYDLFGELDTMFGDQHDSLFASLTYNDESTPNDDDNAGTGIQRRQREPKLCSATLNQRIRLQTRKLESRNGESVRGTIKIVQDVHLDLCDDGNPATAESKPHVQTSRASEIVAPRDLNARKGSARRGSNCLFMRALRVLSSCHSSDSGKCFLLIACVMGVAALILCFLLRDPQRLIGSSSALEL